MMQKRVPKRKIEMPVKEIIGEVIAATVSEDASGIHIRLRTDDDPPNNFEVCFVPAEALGRIGPDKNPKIELQKVANLLNGLDINGKEPSSGRTVKNIRLIKEGL